MPIVTLLTDLGNKDHYLATVKADIYTKIPNARIIDISNDINKFNIFEASFLLKNAFSHFPEGTFHLIGITSNQTRKNRFLVFYFQKQFILTPDNGVFQLFTEEKAQSVLEINHNQSNSPRFLSEILIETAQHIVNNVPAEEIGQQTSEYIKLLPFHPTITSYSITGCSIYIDSFGNVITNISEKIFHETGKGRSFKIPLPGENISEISENYSDVRIGDALAFFNSGGNLEIAINGENASKMIFPRQVYQTEFQITIEFLD